MRTTRKVKEEYEKAVMQANNHYNNCNTCQGRDRDETSEDFYHNPYPECFAYQFLIDDAESLSDQIDYLEQVFQQELKERGEDVILTKRKTLKH